MTASSAGTSTPSLKQRALVSTRQLETPSCATVVPRLAPVRPASSAPDSQDSSPVRSMMFIEPSTWRTSTDSSCRGASCEPWPDEDCAASSESSSVRR